MHHFYIPGPRHKTRPAVRNWMIGPGWGGLQFSHANSDRSPAFRQTHVLLICVQDFPEHLDHFSAVNVKVQDERAVINPNSQSLKHVFTPPGEQTAMHTSSNLRFLNRVTLPAGWGDDENMRASREPAVSYLHIRWWSRTGRIRVQYGGSHS